MKKIMKLNFLFILALLFCASAFAQVKKIACVGNSITFGYGLPNRDTTCYPYQLGKILSPGFETKNFGVSSATLLKNGDCSYWKQKEYQEIFTYKPDIIIIKLGTNDSKPHNWKHKAEFVLDYEEMIQNFKNISTHPQIWVCLPVPVYALQWGINDSIIRNEIIPFIKQIARETNVNLIDLYQPLSGKPEMFPDNVHPDARGAKIMAEVIAATILKKDNK